MSVAADRHCDEYIEDESAHPALRAFLEYNRRPAIEKTDGVGPKLFATYNGSDALSAPKGTHCRVVMASRFGDVGVRFSDLSRDYGYSTRCAVSELADFSEME
jgi:hypothetical protein